MKSWTGKLSLKLQADRFLSDSLNALNTGINKGRLRIRQKP